ncbi:MAG: hypothetical protein V1738_03730 [Patescibacteria group bacterium]
MWFIKKILIGLHLLSPVRDIICSAGKPVKDGSILPLLFSDPKGCAAIHEAGHILACWQLPSIKYISCAKISTRASKVAITYEYAPSYRSFASDTLLISLAGLAAELEIFRYFQAKSSRDDLRHALRAARIINRTSHRAFTPISSLMLDFADIFVNEPSYSVNQIMNWHLMRTQNLIRQHDVKLIQLALALLDRDELSHNDIYRVIGARPCR